MRIKSKCLVLLIAIITFSSLYLMFSSRGTVKKRKSPEDQWREFETLVLQIADGSSGSQKNHTQQLRMIAQLVSQDVVISQAVGGKQPSLKELTSILDRFKGHRYLEQGNPEPLLLDSKIEQVQKMIQSEAGYRLANFYTEIPRWPPISNLSLENLALYVEQMLEKPDMEMAPVPKMHMEFMPYIKKKNYRKPPCQLNPSVYGTMKSVFRQQHYMPDLKVFSDKDDVNTYVNFYKLIHYYPPYGFKNMTREKVGNIMNNPNFTNYAAYALVGRTKECVSCAVIGAGGILNGSGRGKEIDSHDYVFRMNKAYTSANFSQDVGKKTDFYLFYPESENIDLVTGPDSDPVLIFIPKKTYDYRYIDSLLKGKDPPIYKYNITVREFRNPHLNLKRLKLLHPDFMRYIYNRIHKKSTTGAIATTLALHLCDQVTAYGMGYDHTYTTHYYDTRFKTLPNDKDYTMFEIANERKLLFKLEKENIIKLFTKVERDYYDKYKANNNV